MIAKIHSGQHALAHGLLTTVLLLSLGCGDDADSSDPTAGAGGSSGTGGSLHDGGGGVAGDRDASGGSGSSGDGGMSGTGGGEPTPPPEMPRDLGPADGIYCESHYVPPPETCDVGEKCCPNSSTKVVEVCVPGGDLCPGCQGNECGQMLCDGPEDCGGEQFCCFAERGFCRNNSEVCIPAYPSSEESSWMTVECRSRCVGEPFDPDHGIVVCKDDRDCPGPLVTGRCKPLLDNSVIPNGIQICSGP